MRLARPAALVVVALAGALTHFGESPSAATVAPAATFHFRLGMAGLARDGMPSEVRVSTSSVYQGGTLMVTVTEAQSGSATVFGRASPLAPLGGGLVGFVGFGTEDPPGPAVVTVSYTSAGGSERVTRPITVVRTRWTVDYIDLPPGVGELLDPVLVAAEERLLATMYSGDTARKWDGAWIVPLDLSGHHVGISGYFGEQRSFNGGPVGGHHGGTDIGADSGTPVGSTNTGVVVLAARLTVRGNMVIIDHGGGVLSGYAHLESISVAVGQPIAKGQVLGFVGTTGLSTGPHLHWEMSVSGVLVDGLRWLDGSQGF